jgi:hypothetical protein
MLQQLRQCLIQYCTVDKSKALTVAPYTSFSTALLFSTLTPHCCVRQLGIGLLGAGCLAFARPAGALKFRSSVLGCDWDAVL